MPRQKKGLTKEEKLAKDRERKREKYLEIKNNPELYAIQKEKERKRYLVRKTTKKICSIKEMTPRNQREQRKRWRRNSRKYLKKKEDQKKLVGILINNTPSDSETDLQIQNHNSNEPELDPLELIHEKIGSLRNKSEVRRRQHVKIHNVQIEIVDEDEVAKERFPKNIPTFKGTMKVHQVVWSFSQPYIIALRALSCFACNDNFAPCSHGKHLGNSYFNALSNETAISNQLIDGRQEDNLLSDGLHIDSPTLACNIDDTNLQIDSPTLVHNMEELNTDIIPDSPMLVDNVTPKVKILSDIRINWQNLSFYIKPSQTFNPFDQSDFKKFIQERAEEASTFDVDCYASAHNCESSNKENYFGHPYDELIKNSDTVAVNNHKISLNKESTIMEIDEPQKEFITKNSHKYNLMDSDGKYNIDDWVIVEYKIKTKSIYFIGKIIAKIDNSEYKLHFLKKTQGAQSGIKFVWPINIDEDTIPEFQIVQQLEAPQENRRGQLFFKKLPSLNFK
ncbi:hypothetical protein ACJJTC_004477 [Scirpophaga incertulas]